MTATLTAPPPTTRRKFWTLTRLESMWAYILIGPWILGFIAFTLGPMIASLVFSFTDYTVAKPVHFVGLDNFSNLFLSDYRFWLALRVTMTYAVFAIPIGLVLGLLLALLLNAKIPGVSIWRTVYYTPSVVSGVAVAVLWLYLFNPQYGVINWLLSLIGISPGPGWLGSVQWALPALIIMSLWGVGGGMIIYLAGLQGIPTVFYEAAEVDGANKLQTFFNITLPMISPVLFYNLVIGIISTFQIFTSVFVMTKGGPAESTLFYNLYLYNQAFQFQRMGYASAMAWVLFIVVLVLTLLVFRSSSLWVYYEGELKRR